MELNTKWGTARLNESTGYYRVQNSENGISNRFLHHLIWEDHYSQSIPEDCVIHHINNIKTDNRIQNLICVPKKVHDSYHSRHRSEETIQKIKDTLTLDYYRIVKNGYNSNRKQKYGIIFKGHIIKQSTSPSYLERWFKENYPDEFLQEWRDN